MFGVRIVAVVSAGMFSLAGEAAQIYLCKTNQGGTYWASAWCRKTGGYTVDAVAFAAILLRLKAIIPR